VVVRVEQMMCGGPRVVQPEPGGPGDGGRLPPRAVWITFDDGDPTVVDVAQPVLDEAGITASMFVCPAVIGTQTPFWWQIAYRAIDEGLALQNEWRTWTDHRAVTALKLIDDTQRRRVVARAEAELRERMGHPYRVAQLSVEQLRRWISAGHHIGNHTWDHPCLDRCSVEEQRRQ
jgi:peptidoglycan/xylan/chitin deacetylase (PgdA/CDA1 family)